MNVVKTSIPDLKILEPDVFCDERGAFYESFNQRSFDEEVGVCPLFVQDNHSNSIRGVVRGLHYQLPPKAQGKLVRAVYGEVFDVAVDIRRSSPTFGRWVGVVLSAENKRQFWIPEGFAHGFIVTSDRAEIVYKTSNYYAPALDRCIRWDDETIGIDWPIDGGTILSAKDAKGLRLKEAELYE